MSVGYSELAFDTGTIAGPARAAILLLAMGSDGASRLLKHLSPEEIRALKASVAEQQPVSAQQLDLLVTDFQEEFKTGAGISELDSELTKLLRGALSEDELSEVFGDDGAPDPSMFLAPPLTVWEEFEKLGVEALQMLLLVEHPQVVAIILSRLPAEASALIVAGFESDRRNEVMRRMLAAKPIAAAADMMIAESLREVFIANDEGSEKKARRAALAEIANQMDKAQTDEFLASIAEIQPEEATAIRNLLFSFEDIPNLGKKARLVLFDEVSTEQVTLALRNAPAELVEVILSSLAARARRMVEAELQQTIDVNAKEITTARRAIASLALRLATEGRITLTAVADGE
jgi:flagellar motor switch protein FliG